MTWLYFVISTKNQRDCSSEFVLFCQTVWRHGNDVKYSLLEKNEWKDLVCIKLGHGSPLSLPVSSSSARNVKTIEEMARRKRRQRDKLYKKTVPMCGCTPSHTITGWSGDSSAVRATDSWSKGREFESRQERRENFLLRINFVCWLLFWYPFHPPPPPTPCYHSSTDKIPVILPKVQMAGYS